MNNFQFAIFESERLPPDEIKSGDIFSRLGYGISDAIADLVDNSIDAGARKVHIRFVRDTEGIHSVIIADADEWAGEGKLKDFKQAFAGEL